MTYQLSLSATANQTLSAVLETFRYVVTLRTTPTGDTLATVEKDGTVLIQNSRVVANRFIIPYKHLEGTGGNFLIDTDSDTLPDYTLFGTTQNLVYLTNAEMALLRAA